MRKYLFVFSIYWQEGLQQRASFLMERFRAFVVLVSFYYFWSALLKNNSTFAGYDRNQMITYLLGMNLLRSMVFASRTYEIAYEINHGRLAAYLLKPINFILYTFFRDLSEKTINLVSAIIEIIALWLLFGIALQSPSHALQWVAFFVACIGAMLLYFLLSFLVGCWGFWTAESGGPRFLLELFLEFTAGAFFPLDVLPTNIQQILKGFPSPYMVFFPLQVFLGKIDSHEIINGFLIQWFWITVIGGLTWMVWARGLRTYSAEGA